MVLFTLKNKNRSLTDAGPLVLHEFTHIVTYALVGEGAPTGWLWEGKWNRK